MANKNYEPEVRFKKYNSSWEDRKLKDVSTYSNGGSFENDVQDNGQLELVTLKSVDMSGKLVNSGRFININTPTLPKGTLVMILSEQSPGLLGMTAQIPEDNKYVLNQRVAEIRPNNNVDSYFLSMTINKNQQYFGKRGAGTKVQNISKPNVENFSFSCPSIYEQSQIGKYFQNLDKLITLHQKKYDKLVFLKKAMLEKMFPKNGATVPEIRFKGFSNEWEEKCLGDNGNTFTGLSGKTKDDFGHGEGKFVTYMNVFSNPISNPIMTESVEIDNAQNSIQYGDVFFTTSSETPEEVGMSSVWLGKSENIYLNSFCFGYRMTIDIDPYFMAYLLRSSSVRNKIIFLAQGISRFNISKTKVMDITIAIPTMDEQVKVGKYFMKLDKSIALHQKELDKLKIIKKACLAKMFV